MNKKIAALVTAGALALGGIALAAPAAADEAAPTQEVASSPDTPITSASEAAPPTSPTTDSPAAPTSEAITTPSADPASPPAASPAVTATIPSAPSQPTPSVERQVAPEKITEWHTWLVTDPSKTGPVGHVSVNAAYFPQDSLKGTIVQPLCGQLVQQDQYTGTRAQLDALYAHQLTWNVQKGHASDNDIPGLSVDDWNLVYGGICPPTIASTLTAQAVCNVNTYDITWTGTVATEHAAAYIAQRVKVLGATPSTIQDGFAPGSGFSFVTHEAGSATSATANVHVHVTQAAAGVNPLDTDATATIALDGNCNVPPQQCVPTGNWYTEDAAPVQREDGLYFEGQGTAVDWYHPVTGNLQGLGNQSITFAGVAGYQPSYTIVLWRTGNTGYANLVAEWYMNGGSASTDGTFAVTPATLFWTNKIASGPGSQGDAQPLSFFVDLWPSNQLIAVGPHLGSASQSSTHSTVTALGGCVTASFVPTKPEGTTRTVERTVTDCDAKTVTLYTDTYSTESVWDAESHSYVDGEETGPVTTHVTRDATDEECPLVVTPPTETPTPTPATAVVVTPTPTSGVLAKTGSNIYDATPIALLGGGGIAVGLIILAVLGLARGRRRGEQN